MMTRLFTEDGRLQVHGRHMDVDVATPALRGAWETTLLEDPDALPTQQPAWVDAVCASGRWRDASRLYRTADGRRLVLPMVRRVLRRPGRGRGVDADALGLRRDRRRRRRHRGRRHARARRSRGAPDRPPEHPPQPAPRSPLHRARPAREHRDRPPRPCPGPRRRRRRRVEGIRRQPAPRGEEGGAVGRRGRVRHDRTAAPRVLRAATPARSCAGPQQQHEPAWLARTRTRFRDSLAKWQTIARHLDGGCRQWVARHDGRAGRVDHRALRGERALHARRDGQGARRTAAGQRPADVAGDPGRVRDRGRVVPPGGVRHVRVARRTTRSASAPDRSTTRSSGSSGCRSPGRTGAPGRS